MKRHTDFNDLATQCWLGKEAIDRQARALVSDVIRQDGTRIEQHGQHMQSGDGAVIPQPGRHCVAKIS